MPADVAGEPGKGQVACQLERPADLDLGDEVLRIAPQLELGIRRGHVVRLFLGHAASEPAKICQARADLAVRLSTM